MCTYGYKSGWIHVKFSFGPETITAQTSDYKVHHVKSYRAAQLLITRFNKRVS